MTFNKLYWREYTAGKFYFDKYAFEGVRRECLEQIETIKFKHPKRCYKIFYKGKEEWRQYLGAGQTCIPELNI
jgi:hypothetical protein